MAYTKYSLTPSSNTAAPPDGAPEGMLPSAVNDTMRDMMAQIRDCGDGIRDGTYTMTAPKITGGTITGSTINNSAIGGTTAAAGKFTTLEATGVATFSAGAVGTPAITTTGDTNTGIFFPAADTIAFTEGGVESMRIDSSGRLGIGTASPSTKLTVNTAGVAGAMIRLTDGTQQSFDIESDVGAGGAGVISYNTVNGGQQAFKIAGTERMRIDSSGNVGIGTSSPTVKLDVVGAGNLSSRARFTKTGEGILQLGANRDTSACPYIGSENNYPLAFITNDTERMRIDSSGRLLVGSTVTTSGGNTISPGGINITASANFGMGINMPAGDQFAVVFANGGTNVGSISVTGSATAYNTSSDYRLKENVAPMTGALAKVAQLKPVTYKWKADGSDGQGFIAHELQAVVPDCVVGEKDAVDEKGKPKYQGVDASFLVATLTAAIQELKAELDSVKAELQTLKGN